MASQVQVHVVSKTYCSKNHIMSTDMSLLPPLAPDNIRLQVRMAGLTSNNLTYARLAAVANWWDAFPVPDFLPTPYNDPNAYGTVPVWGYAEIISSRTAGLETGAILYGFFPSSTLPVDLQLTPTQPAGHFIDTTPHRQSLWSYYHRYTLAPANLDFTSPQVARELVFKPLFECSHALNAHVLGPLALHPSSSHPDPETPWPSLADSFASTTVISLSASGKTARAFNDAILNARPENPPQAFVAITSNPATLTLPLPAKSPVKTKVLSYPAALDGSTLPEFLASLFSPSSQSSPTILIADFGARNNSLPPLLSLLRSSLPPPTTLTIIGIGAEPLRASEYSLERALEGMGAVPEKVQMNTSVVREQAVGVLGEEAYFGAVERGWEGFVARGGCEGGGGVGIGAGVGGFGEGWGRVCEGVVGGGEVFVF